MDGPSIIWLRFVCKYLLRAFFLLSFWHLQRQISSLHEWRRLHFQQLFSGFSRQSFHWMEASRTKECTEWLPTTRYHIFSCTFCSVLKGPHNRTRLDEVFTVPTHLRGIGSLLSNLTAVPKSMSLMIFVSLSNIMFYGFKSLRAKLNLTCAWFLNGVSRKQLTQSDRRFGMLPTP